ncbi:MAG: Gfo/Idh/MocA family oxidoreductase [Bacteroidota bacterium]|nr:Gfo/Idh/MocA family oxidoreductase [Bacteroidota bacterium]MDP4215940.1 Gfo/Idh/MocA family oxidoreductase [Bacteroidota bacterium]MDP4245217.1 Gfo/Idh/MocA family oxidoreductase [Bacteroidota bacterium]MDP4259209.1 Gfo/Idh/MocA family oxidoreductase [Bacteroidota bacterium]
MKKKKKGSLSRNISRKDFISRSIKATLGTSLAWSSFPAIVPASVFGPHAPSNRINIGAIGTGRISRGHDMPGVLKYDTARIMAVCDLDADRAEDAKKWVNDFYASRSGKPYDGVSVYHDHRELLENKDIDAVLISTPDHWHALAAIHAVNAGKDVYLQKPASLTIAEGRTLSDVVTRSGRIFQIGSQQRSSTQFRYAAELVRNGRIGRLKTVYVGLPGDPSGGDPKEMPAPPRFNYDAWLGSTPEVYYTVDRVHPQHGYDRPGWLRCEQFGAGMITGWGAHHVDSAHWGMNTEYTGPIEVWGEAEFPTTGLWNVHGTFKTQALYANGVTMMISDTYPNGVKFEGTEGWIFVTRGDYRATASDPVPDAKGVKPLEASDPKIIRSVIGPNEIHLYESDDHHGNWLECIRTRKTPATTVEMAHRACSACLLHHMVMRLKRKLYWDPSKELFKNDPEANGRLSRPQRSPYIVKA